MKTTIENIVASIEGAKVVAFGVDKHGTEFAEVVLRQQSEGREDLGLFRGKRIALRTAAAKAGLRMHIGQVQFEREASNRYAGRLAVWVFVWAGPASIAPFERP